MKIKDILKLALLNILSNLKMVFCILIGSVVIIEMIMLSFAYGYSMHMNINNTIDKNASLRYSTVINKELLEKYLVQIKDKSEGIQSIYQYDLFSLCGDNDLEIQETPLENNKVSLDVAILEIDNRKYKGINDYSYDFNLDKNEIHNKKDKNVKFDIGVMDYVDNLQVSENEIDELKNRFNKNDVYIKGGELTGENQIIMTDYLLEKFGFDGNIKNCVGKNISLYIETDKGDKCIIDDYVLKGIIDSDLYRVGSRKSVPQIIVSNANEKYYNNNIIKVFSKKFNDVIKLTDISADIFLWPTDVSAEYSAMETLSIFFDKIVIRIFFIILISILLFVYTVIYFYFKKRTRYICMEKAIGIKNNELYKMIFSELSIMAIGSICLAIPLGYVIITYMNVVMNNLVGSSYSITVSVIGLSSIVAIITEMILIAGISYMEYSKTKKYSVINREI